MKITSPDINAYIITSQQYIIQSNLSASDGTYVCPCKNVQSACRYVQSVVPNPDMLSPAPSAYVRWDGLQPCKALSPQPPHMHDLLTNYRIRNTRTHEVILDNSLNTTIFHSAARDTAAEYVAPKIFPRRFYSNLIFTATSFRSLFLVVLHQKAPQLIKVLETVYPLWFPF